MNQRLAREACGMAVHFAVDGPVAVVTIDRPSVRNAVDGPTESSAEEPLEAADIV